MSGNEREPQAITSCSGCGACCREQESPPMFAAILGGCFDVDEDDEDAALVSALPDALKQELLAYIENMRAGLPHPKNGVCLWYDEKTSGCKHYDHRPTICRDFELNSEACHEWRNLYEIGTGK